MDFKTQKWQNWPESQWVELDTGLQSQKEKHKPQPLPKPEKVPEAVDKTSLMQS